MAWVIFFLFWIVFLWLYRYSERHKQTRVQGMQRERQTDYGKMKEEFDGSMELFHASTDFKTRHAHIDKAIECLKVMEEMAPGKEHSSEKLPQLVSLKQALIYSDIKEQYENAMKNAREAALLITKVNHVTAAQSILNEGLRLGIDEKTLSKEIGEANNFINSIQYDEYLAKARKEENKGNVKTAIDQYQVALYFLKMTGMGGEGQNAQMKDIEGKIERLHKRDET